MEWNSLPTPDKEIVKAEIREWLLENYKPSSDACLSRDSVYEHYVIFSQLRNLPTGGKHCLTKILNRLYSHICLRRKGPRNKNKYYYCGIDIDPKSNGYKMVSRTRLVNDEPVEIPETLQLAHGDSGEAKIPETTQLACDDSEKAKKSSSEAKDKEHSPSHHQHDSKMVKDSKWMDLTPAQKEMYREKAMEWFDTDFEISPATCLLRQTVYNCYVKFCKDKDLMCAPQAMFGVLLLKKFRRLTSRRLGVRGDSKYYYMGIDVREDSKFHAKISANKIMCTSGKPKISRAFNGSPISPRLDIDSYDDLPSLRSSDVKRLKRC